VHLGFQEKRRRAKTGTRTKSIAAHPDGMPVLLEGFGEDILAFQKNACEDRELLWFDAFGVVFQTDKRSGMRCILSVYPRSPALAVALLSGRIGPNAREFR